MHLRILGLALLGLLFNIVLFAQLPDQSDDQLNIYVDCRYCDMTLIRTKVDYVSYVRDREVADVHLLVNRVVSGSNGYNYSFQFLGKNRFDGNIQELSMTELPNTSSQQRQTKIIQVIETGLVPFWMQTGLRDQMELEVSRSDHGTRQAKAIEDPWNNWIFSIEAGGSADLESNTNEYVGWARVRADRVSEIWRIRNLLYARYDTRRFEKEEEIITSDRERSYGTSSVVRSLSDHFSAGMFASLSRSTFSNLDLSTRIAPAFEYSIFPYSEVHERSVTISYRVSHLYRDYTEETIFFRLAEHLYNQSIVFAARFKQPWGSLYAQLEGSHFFHDPSQNRLEFEGYLSFRVAKGLSITVGNEFEVINDQRSLPARDISLEELLLAQRQSATNFRINGRLGFKYTFGSIYNNVINTRL